MAAARQSAVLLAAPGAYATYSGMGRDLSGTQAGTGLRELLLDKQETAQLATRDASELAQVTAGFTADAQPAASNVTSRK